MRVVGAIHESPVGGETPPLQILPNITVIIVGGGTFDGPQNAIPRRKA